MTNKMLPSGISVRVREDLIDGASRTQTTLIIDPIVTLSGHRILMTDIGSIGYGKIDQGKAAEEIISWTGITDNGNTFTLTGCVWGINFHNLSNATANIKRHVSGAQFAIMTDMHYIASQLVTNYDPETINGFTPTKDYNLTTKTYVDTRDGYWRGAVTDYASLPTGVTDGEVRVTLDDSKIYVWDSGTTVWTLAGAGGGAGTVYITTKLGTEAVGNDNKTFQLNSGSFPDKKYLQVYLNGLLQDEGATDDYVATGSNQAVFNEVVNDTDRVTLLVISVDLYNPDWNTVNADILPDVDNTHDIGSSTKKFKDLYINNIEGNIGINGDVDVTGDISAVDITATTVSGDGSGLTGVISATTIASTTSEALSATNVTSAAIGISSISDTVTMPADANFAIAVVHCNILDNNSVSEDIDITLFITRYGNSIMTSPSFRDFYEDTPSKLQTTGSISTNVLTITCQGRNTSANTHGYTLSGTVYFFK